jgi:hypothetical protein
MLPHTYKEPYGNHTCHIVPKRVKMCVYKIHIKGRCNNVHFGEVCTAKRSWQGARFCRTLGRRVRARKPRRELGVALYFCGVLRLTNEFKQNRQKASVKI